MEGELIHMKGYLKGRGKLHLHTSDKGEKFEIVTLSADEIQLRTLAQMQPSDIISMKIQIDEHNFMVNVNAIGEVMTKETYEEQNEYVVRFVNMSESDKADIDELIKDNIMQ